MASFSNETAIPDATRGLDLCPWSPYSGGAYKDIGADSKTTGGFLLPVNQGLTVGGLKSGGIVDPDEHRAAPLPPAVWTALLWNIKTINVAFTVTWNGTYPESFSYSRDIDLSHRWSAIGSAAAGITSETEINGEATAFHRHWLLSSWFDNVTAFNARYWTDLTWTGEVQPDVSPAPGNQPGSNSFEVNAEIQLYQDTHRRPTFGRFLDPFNQAMVHPRINISFIQRDPSGMPSNLDVKITTNGTGLSAPPVEYPGCTILGQPIWFYTSNDNPSLASDPGNSDNFDIEFAVTATAFWVPGDWT